MPIQSKSNYGGIGLGDISGWARATVPAARPNEMILRRNGRLSRSPKVRDFAALRAFHEKLARGSRSP